MKFNQFYQDRFEGDKPDFIYQLIAIETSKTESCSHGKFVFDMYDLDWSLAGIDNDNKPKLRRVRRTIFRDGRRACHCFDESETKNFVEIPKELQAQIDLFTIPKK